MQPAPSPTSHEILVETHSVVKPIKKGLNMGW